jgi:putative ubiquitin-RnfH superfamily antitoxin RatB of RatAB toxin-antitoxin module
MADTKSQPSYHILICLIQIWKMAKADDPLTVPSTTINIAEVENIEIDDSYKKLIGTASVKFPRGTILRKTVTSANIDEVAASTKLDASLNEQGVLVTTRTNSKLSETSDFNIDDRIRIYVNYTTDPKIAALTKVNNGARNIYNDGTLLNKYKQALGDPMFDGYITKVSVDTPIELQCENLASKLKKITCPKVVASKNMTVNDFLADNGKYKLLKNTGLSLYPQTASCDINIGKVSLSRDLTVADVLTEWGKFKLFAFIKVENGNPYIAVGRSYFSNPGKDSIFRAQDTTDTKEILFDYNVAENGLSLMNTKKEFLAVEASCYDTNQKFYHITLRLNPQYNAGDANSEKWQVMNEAHLSKKAMKLGATVLSKSGSDRVDLSTYTVVPYMSRVIGISHENLLKEAKQYFESYNMNGIEGTLTLFGDLMLRSGTKVHLYDKRYKKKNGYYLVDEVHTSFGVRGFRQTIKLPYLIARDKTDSNK